MALCAGLGCQGGESKPLKDGAGDGGGGAAGTSGISSQQGAGNAGSGGTSGSTSSSVCFYDSPCQYAYKCTAGGSGYQHYQTAWSPGGCSGGYCYAAGDPVACPAGTRCLGGSSFNDGFNELSQACQPIPDAGPDRSAVDAQVADRGLKPPIDTANADVPTKPLVDALTPDVVPACVAGERRCRGNDPIAQACSTAGQWRDEMACDYLCSAGACIGECTPGLRRRCRATGEIPQVCNSMGSWVDEAACSGSTPYCATGQCVAACLRAGQDCTDSKTACCAGTECVSTTSDSTFACKAIPACAALGGDCAANTDCCAGLDCTAGKCVAKVTSCFDHQGDGDCGGTTGATCCPGTVCSNRISGDTQGCAIPSTTKPQEGGCPREQPALHEPCRAAKLGLNCGYSDWAKLPGIFFNCTCSYHGWSCTKNYYVH